MEIKDYNLKINHYILELKNSFEIIVPLKFIKDVAAHIESNGYDATIVNDKISAKKRESPLRMNVDPSARLELNYSLEILRMLWVGDDDPSIHRAIMREKAGYYPVDIYTGKVMCPIDYY